MNMKKCEKIILYSSKFSQKGFRECGIAAKRALAHLKYRGFKSAVFITCFKRCCILLRALFGSKTLSALSFGRSIENYWLGTLVALTRLKKEKGKRRIVRRCTVCNLSSKIFIFGGALSFKVVCSYKCSLYDAFRQKYIFVRHTAAVYRSVSAVSACSSCRVRSKCDGKTSF